MVLSRPFDSFQDHCILCILVYIFNIFGAISKRAQAKTSSNTFKFKFSNSIVSIVSIVHPYEQI